MTWFPHGVSVVRERRPLTTDPHDPDHEIRGAWADVGEDDRLTIDQAYVAQSSTATAGDATRTQVLTSLSLYCADPAADVQTGDRIVADGQPPLYVTARPDAPRNPFTGWQPVLEVPLDLSEG